MKFQTLEIKNEQIVNHNDPSKFYWIISGNDSLLVKDYNKLIKGLGSAIPSSILYGPEIMAELPNVSRVLETIAINQALVCGQVISEALKNEVPTYAAIIFVHLKLKKGQKNDHLILGSRLNLEEACKRLQDWFNENIFNIQPLPFDFFESKNESVFNESLIKLKDIYSNEFELDTKKIIGKDKSKYDWQHTFLGVYGTAEYVDSKLDKTQYMAYCNRFLPSPKEDDISIKGIVVQFSPDYNAKLEIINYNTDGIVKTVKTVVLKSNIKNRLDAAKFIEEWFDNNVFNQPQPLPYDFFESKDSSIKADQSYEYKVGDKVRIIRKGSNWNPSGKMDKWLGKIMTIKQIYPATLTTLSIYKMEEDQDENNNYGWSWMQDCFELVSDYAAVPFDFFESKESSSKPKYNVGDKVRIIGQSEDSYWDAGGQMKKWIGKIMTIKEHSDNNCYYMEEDQDENYGGWCWLDTDFEPVYKPLPLDFFEDWQNGAVIKPKYKPGDKVVIKRKTDPSFWNFEGQMDKWIGKTMTIKSIEKGFYKMEEDQGEGSWGSTDGWTWSEQDLEPVAITLPLDFFENKNSLNEMKIPADWPKVGDKVIVARKSPEWNLAGEMDKWLGKTMTVRKLVDKYNGKYTAVKLEEDKYENHGDGWYWPIKDLDPNYYTLPMDFFESTNGFVSNEDLISLDKAVSDIDHNLLSTLNRNKADYYWQDLSHKSSFITYKDFTKNYDSVADVVYKITTQPAAGTFLIRARIFGSGSKSWLLSIVGYIWPSSGKHLFDIREQFNTRDEAAEACEKWFDENVFESFKTLPFDFFESKNGSVFNEDLNESTDEHDQAFQSVVQKFKKLKNKTLLTTEKTDYNWCCVDRVKSELQFFNDEKSIINAVKDYPYPEIIVIYRPIDSLIQNCQPNQVYYMFFIHSMITATSSEYYSCSLYLREADYSLLADSAIYFNTLKEAVNYVTTWSKDNIFNNDLKPLPLPLPFDFFESKNAINEGTKAIDKYKPGDKVVVTKILTDPAYYPVDLMKMWIDKTLTIKSRLKSGYYEVQEQECPFIWAEAELKPASNYYKSLPFDFFESKNGTVFKEDKNESIS